MRKYAPFITGLCIAVSMVMVPTVMAANFGLDETAGAAGLTGYGNSVPTIAGNIIGTLLSMISVLFFVLVLYGGILWMTARGNSEQTGKALNTIIGATIGIIIVMGAYALTNFVFQLGGNAGGGGGNTTPTPTPTAQGRCVVDQEYCTQIQGQGGVICSTTNDDDRVGYCMAGGANGITCVAVTSSGHKCEMWNNDEDGCNGDTKCRWQPS